LRISQKPLLVYSPSLLSLDHLAANAGRQMGSSFLSMAVRNFNFAVFWPASSWHLFLADEISTLSNTKGLTSHEEPRFPT
jgi:hypothetical protein